MDLNQEEIDLLTRIAGLIIPASPAHGAPGADDPRIMAEVLRSAARDSATVRRAVSAFASCETAEAFRAEQPDHAERLQSLVALAYYRDSRVLRSVGAAARAPFPEGYKVDDGDWSVLEPVRARGEIWRRVE